MSVKLSILFKKKPDLSNAEFDVGVADVRPLAEQ